MNGRYLLLPSPQDGHKPERLILTRIEYADGGFGVSSSCGVCHYPVISVEGGGLLHVMPTRHNMAGKLSNQPDTE